MSCSFKIDVIDMPGVTSRLLNLVDDLNINLMAMEVVPGEIYIRVGDLPECKKVKNNFYKITSTYYLNYNIEYIKDCNE